MPFTKSSKFIFDYSHTIPNTNVEFFRPASPSATFKSTSLSPASVQIPESFHTFSSNQERSRNCFASFAFVRKRFRNHGKYIVNPVVLITSSSSSSSSSQTCELYAETKKVNIKYKEKNINVKSI